MSEFDPVPTGCILEIDAARKVIPDNFLGNGYGTPRELALQVLVDEDELASRELFLFQRLGHGDVQLFFENMWSMFDERRGRHVQWVIAAACLHPERETSVDLPSAATAFMETHGSVVDDLLTIRMMTGNLSTSAFMDVDENVRKVQSGQLYLPDSRI